MQSPLIWDACSLLNLVATDRAFDILSSMDRESYVPEKAWTADAFETPAKAGEPAADLSGGAAGISSPAAPLRLLLPVEVPVMVSPSDDRNGRPVAFTWNDQTHRVVHAVGPHRIAGQWWEEHDKTRDYFDVADDAGQRFWIFRVLQTAKWYVQGVYE